MRARPAAFRPRPRGFAPSRRVAEHGRQRGRLGHRGGVVEQGFHPDRLTFVPGDGVVCFVNSIELRHIVAKGGVFPRAGGQQGEFTLERKEEADAQDWCR